MNSFKKYLLTTMLIFLLMLMLLNLLYIPRGVHLAKFAADPASLVKSDNAGNFLDLIMTNLLSEIIFRHTGVYCNAPYYDNRGVFIEGEDLTIEMLVAAISEDGIQNREIARRELIYALSRCDPNKISPDAVVPPLYSAILFKDLETTLMLLKHGANPELRIIREGSGIDGLNALEFAKYLSEKSRTGEEKIAYMRILNEIEKFIKTKSVAVPE